jgi:hypothetical protein
LRLEHGEFLSESSSHSGSAVLLKPDPLYPM